MQGQPAPDDADPADPFPDLLFTTIRVERVAEGRFRATQRDSAFRGVGPTPHRAVADYAERVEAGCLDRTGGDDG